MDNKKLFSEFQPASTKEWEQKLNEDLKGADYEKKLVWDTGEGFRTRPYYRLEDLEGLEYLRAFPGEFPFVRGNKPGGNEWYVRQEIKVLDVKKANEKALDILMKGVDSLGFILDEDHEYSKEELDILLKNIFAEIVEINFECGGNAAIVMQNHYDMIQRYNRDFQKIIGSIDYDPLGRLVLKGNFYRTRDEDFEIAKKLIDIATHLPHFQVLAVHGQHFHNAGASIVEELAFSLASGTEYLTQLTEKGLSVNRVAPKIKFHFGIGSNFFMEIAKIRAARLLWAHIVKAYGVVSPEMAKMNIRGITSRWNMTVYDPHVNLLRTTTEAISAVVGGVDSLTVRPFDFVFRPADDFSERIARNQQLLIKEESYLDQVADPAAGSYFVEKLTDSIASEAWKLFLEVDAKGGFLQALKDGFIQDKIKQTAQKRDQDISSRKTTILGTNQYPEFKEQLELDDESCLSPDQFNEKGAIVEPLRPYRGAMGFERLRYLTDKYSKTHKRPAAFMFTYGNLAMRVARSQFSRNFFAVAGYDVIDNIGFKSIQEGIDAVRKSKPEIVVLCSSDEEYSQIAPEIYDSLKNTCIIVIAGYPKDSIDELKAKGVQHFIHVRSNLLETLSMFSELLGIK